MKPKIYIFLNSIDGSEGLAAAMSEDGNLVSSHYCSNEYFAEHDLRHDSHVKDYEKYYPDGYELEFIPSKEIKTHKGLTDAISKYTFKIDKKAQGEL